MTEQNDEDRGTIPAGDVLFGLVVLFRNLSRHLVEQGMISKAGLHDLILQSLRDCAHSQVQEQPATGAMDFVWSLLDDDLIVRVRPERGQPPPKCQSSVELQVLPRSTIDRKRAE